MFWLWFDYWANYTGLDGTANWTTEEIFYSYAANQWYLNKRGYDLFKTFYSF